MRKPSWVFPKPYDFAGGHEVRRLMRQLRLATVCESARCPNRGECLGAGTATFLILGEVCTRRCGFCAIAKGLPELPDPHEPAAVAEAVRRLGLAYAVVTSVTRDDLPDGGASQFAATISAIHEMKAQIPWLVAAVGSPASSFEVAKAGEIRTFPVVDSPPTGVGRSPFLEFSMNTGIPHLERAGSPAQSSPGREDMLPSNSTAGRGEGRGMNGMEFVRNICVVSENVERLPSPCPLPPGEGWGEGAMEFVRNSCLVHENSVCQGTHHPRPAIPRRGEGNSVAGRVGAEVPAVEVLIPDFAGKPGALETVLAAGPTVLNHNLETVPRLYPRVRPGAHYGRSLALLGRAREIAPAIPTKSGIMLGLGEEFDEVVAVLRDLAAAGCASLTIGQYLQPQRESLPVERYWRPEEFAAIEAAGRAAGIARVSAGPLVRSSYRARELFDEQERLNPHISLIP